MRDALKQTNHSPRGPRNVDAMIHFWRGAHQAIHSLRRKSYTRLEILLYLNVM